MSKNIPAFRDAIAIEVMKITLGKSPSVFSGPGKPFPGSKKVSIESHEDYIMGVAKGAYALADAMLAARESGSGEGGK